MEESVFGGRKHVIALFLSFRQSSRNLFKVEIIYFLIIYQSRQNLLIFRSFEFGLK